MRQKAYNNVYGKRLTLLYMLVLLAIPSIRVCFSLHFFSRSLRVHLIDGSEIPHHFVRNRLSNLYIGSGQYSSTRVFDDNSNDTAVIPNMTYFIIQNGYIFLEAVILFKPYHTIKSIFHPPPAVA